MHITMERRYYSTGHHRPHHPHQRQHPQQGQHQQQYANGNTSHLQNSVVSFMKKVNIF